MFLAIIRLSIILGIALAVCEAGEVICLQRVPIFTCAKMSCPDVGWAVTHKRYSCDCFKIEKVLGKNRKWYKIELPNGHGYVTNDHCSGNVPAC
ncbi:unnamed protein product [Adineta steineri]|uniref:Uncharacterized protein n=1 Tax=Adineta steineri TaxID=433720 RepID=A0A820BMW6_9BILA|nr:unnamed protein product [Adineta steineri]